MVLAFNARALQREETLFLLVGEVYRLTILGQESHWQTLLNYIQFHELHEPLFGIILVLNVKILT